jgi:hypothetical protein
MKVYAKRIEMIDRRKGGQFIEPALLDWAAGVVRFELTMRGPELEQERLSVAQLRGLGARDVATELWARYFDRITFNENANMATPSLLEGALPPHLALKLAAWRGGANMRQLMSRTAFYRVRRELLDSVGVDIASPPPPLAQGQRSAGGQLDPAGWDPEPIEAFLAEPGDAIARQYGLL